VLRQRGVSAVIGEEAEIVDAQDRRALRHLLETAPVSRRAARGDRGGAALRAPVGSVRDTVAGRQRAARRLFEPHFRPPAGERAAAVVQRVATNAGGTVEARNVDGGLEVRLLFPPRA
jgi:hypothetical protein